MKPKSILTSIGLLTLATPMAALICSTPALSSLAVKNADKNENNKELQNSTNSYDNEEWRQYIYDRTFSLQSISREEGNEKWNACWGTGWIISDATPDIADDYSYYVATNWHVYDGMESVKSRSPAGSTKYQFGCKYDSNHLDPFNDFVTFESFENMPEKDFSLDGSTKITINNGARTVTGLKGIDFHISKANFKTVVDNDSKIAQTAKEKLDRLNLNTKENKPITEFAPTTNDSLHFESKNMYTGGYPVHSDKNIEYSPTWEAHDLNGENFKLEYFNDQKNNSYAHDCDETASPLIDCSPQYRFTSPATDEYMSGGASGSMLLGDFGTESGHDFKVCGIYWGGWNSQSGFLPYYSIFNSDYKNFVEQYIK